MSSPSAMGELGEIRCSPRRGAHTKKITHRGTICGITILKTERRSLRFQSTGNSTFKGGKPMAEFSFTNLKTKDVMDFEAKINRLQFRTCVEVLVPATTHGRRFGKQFAMS